MELTPKTLARPIARLGAAAQNALEVARFGGLDTEEEPSPYEVRFEHRVYKPTLSREQAYEIIQAMHGKLERPLVAAFRNVALKR